MDAEEDSRCGDSTHNLFLYLFLFFKEFDSGLASIRNLGPNLHHPQVIYNIYGCYKLTILIHWSGRVAHLGSRLRTASYARKVRKLFQHMDDSGDGALNVEESLGAKRGQSP